MSTDQVAQVSQVPRLEQLTTFYIGPNLFGIDVMRVQEVTGGASIEPVPLTPEFVLGLINLRGQIATALGLRELFGTPQRAAAEQMSVVCKIEGNLISLVVDSIGDVVEVGGVTFEAPPDTIPADVRKFVKGIYKMKGALLSVLDLEALAKQLSPSIEPNSELSA
jgi:purine-binding chemotaxis protein CheW